MFDLFDIQTHKEFRVRFYLIASKVNEIHSYNYIRLSSTEILFSFVPLDTLDSTLIMMFLLLRVRVRGQNLSEVKIKLRTIFFTLVDSQFYKELVHIHKLELIQSEQSELTSGHDSKL